MATARSKISFFTAEPAWAFKRAPTRIFSKTRGTARMKVGLNRARSSMSWETSGVCARAMPASREVTSTNRANTWASGRNSRVRAPSCMSSPATGIVFWEHATKLRWVSSQPLGGPVVPDV